MLSKGNSSRCVYDFPGKDHSLTREAPDDVFEQSVASLTSYIEQLPPQRKHIFRLSKIEGLSYPEIARQLGISEKTVRNHVYRVCCS